MHSSGPDLRGVRVLVTGGGGFLGSHLTRRLLELGCALWVARKPGGDTRKLAGFEDRISLSETDIRSSDSLGALVEDCKPELVFHLAAQIRQDRTADRLGELMSVNVSGTLNLLRLLDARSVRRVVSLGTCDEYGVGPVPFSEAQREQPASPYAISKLFATHLCQHFHRLEGLPVVVVRPTIVYGPGQPERSLIGTLAHGALRGGGGGTASKLTPGQQTRDFIYVDDVISGLLACATSSGVEGEIINLGTGEETRVADVARLVHSLQPSAAAPELGALPYRANEMMRYVCSTEKARRMLKWTPQISLEAGLARTMDWLRRELEAGKRDS